MGTFLLGAALEAAAVPKFDRGSCTELLSCMLPNVIIQLNVMWVSYDTCDEKKLDCHFHTNKKYGTETLEGKKHLLSRVGK